MTSHVDCVTLCVQRFVQARCAVEKGRELPIAACVTGQNFPDSIRIAWRSSLRMQHGVRWRDDHVSNA
ncbi:hypothetical protein CFB84_19225 [Burkholderia aenigmatica]|uniref:Uncharacterized protein n=1 Tax=Burkholderia aenigmatica TaxID=2015348 RepID=A0A228IMS6_9BURK|nr:hypothetical protein CFB84_19225 [Burkholderia aenigmatica]